MPVAGPAAQHPERRAPRLLAHARGVVALEFLLAFLPVFLLFLGIFQLALLAAAKLVVRHAAVTAVRAAVVVLDDDPRHYAGAARGRIDEGAATRSPIEARLAASSTAVDVAGLTGAAIRDGARMAAVRSAAHVPLLAIAPGAKLSAGVLGLVRHSSAASAIGDSPATRIAVGLKGYLPLTTAVTLPVAPGSSELQEAFAHADPVVVRVTHLVPCAVPLAGRLICNRLHWDPRKGTLAAARVGAATRDALEELGRAPFAAHQWGLAHSALPFAVLQAEASMPAQTATYPYASELEAAR